MMRIAGLFTAALLMTGCAANRDYHGVDARPTPRAKPAGAGMRFADFAFRDQEGRMRRLSGELGDYTVLGFTGNDRATFESATELVDAVLQANSGRANVHVVGVVLHRGQRPDGSTDCRLVAMKPNLGTICEASGEIRRLYGVENEDWLVVIGPDRTVALSAPASRAVELSRQLGRQVTELSDMRKQSSFAAFDPRSPFN